MNFLRFFSIVLISASLSSGFEDKTIYQYLVDNGYTLFLSLVREANLDTVLDGTTPYTLLAPSNAALATADPDFLVSLSNNKLLLKSVLQYHILNGFTLIPEFQPGKDEVTLNGQAITVSRVNNTVRLNSAATITSTNDVILKNGVIHPIDAVLVPPVFSTNNLAAEFVINDNLFTEFFFALLLTNMTDLIERGEYTIFAPTDGAFTGTISTIFYRDMPNALHYYTEMLRYHIVPGARTSGVLKNGQVLYTLHGTPIHINITSAGVYADNARVVLPDIGASNGVIHAIDKLLFPDDLRKELETQQAQG